MRHPRSGKPWLLVLLLALALLAVPPVAPVTAGGGPPQQGIARQPLRISFGDVRTQAELTYPATAAGRSPTVILIHGSGLEDRNADICAGAIGGPVLSHIFLDIAQFLTPRGVAVLRYDKHYVTGPCRGNVQKFYGTLTLQQMRADAARVLQTAEANPHVDPRRIFLYGWSEGSTVAAALAAQHPELAGLIVQGPVAMPWRTIFQYQITGVGVPYLRTLAPDGRITTATLRVALAGPGGLVAKEIVLYLADPVAYQRGVLALNPRLDRNHDGAIDFDTEFLPVVPTLLSALLSPRGPLAIYAPGRALPTVTAQAPALRLPVLILQAVNDANVPPRGAQLLAGALARGGNRDHLLKLYPGLGHSLGPAVSVIADNFRPIAPAPLVDLATWLLRHADR